MLHAVPLPCREVITLAVVPAAKIGPLRMPASLARIQGDPTERERLVQRLAQVRGRLEQAYVDKLDGKITEEF